MYALMAYCVFFFFKQKTAHEMRISDWSSDVCSSDLFEEGHVFAAVGTGRVAHYDGAGNFLEILDTTRGGFTTGMGFDEAGNLYVTNFSDASVSRFDNNGNLINSVFVNTGADSPGVEIGRAHV